MSVSLIRPLLLAAATLAVTACTSVGTQKTRHRRWSRRFRPKRRRPKRAWPPCMHSRTGPSRPGRGQQGQGRRQRSHRLEAGRPPLRGGVERAGDPAELEADRRYPFRSWPPEGLTGGPRDGETPSSCCWRRPVGTFRSTSCRSGSAGWSPATPPAPRRSNATVKAGRAGCSRWAGRYSTWTGTRPTLDGVGAAAPDRGQQW